MRYNFSILYNKFLGYDIISYDSFLDKMLTLYFVVGSWVVSFHLFGLALPKQLVLASLNGNVQGAGTFFPPKLSDGSRRK